MSNALAEMPRRAVSRPDGGVDRLRLTAELAAALACSPDRWAPLVAHVPGERWYGRLFDDPEACAWLITWAPGSGLPLHDHGDASASLVVVGGALSERYTSRDDIGRPGARLRSRHLGLGARASFGADHVHEMRNDGTVPAVSIHVYAPRLDNMAFYQEVLG
jgi:hypothetical protein